MSKDKPAAFMSYVHSDDKYGHVTTLRERLSDEVQMLIGTEFPIFQDRKDIQWGQNWSERLEDSLDETTFLIAIITPSFFNSQYCREELSRFLEREKKLNRTDLILPFYFVDTPLLNDDELRKSDELAEVIASRQYADWRELRLEPFTNPLVLKTLAQFAAQIRNALGRVRAARKMPVKTPPAPDVESIGAPTTGKGEQSAEIPTAMKEPPTCIVDPLHHGDFTTITEAINGVAPGTRIIVREGLYEESLVLDKPLEIIGEGDPGDVVIRVAGANVISFEARMGRLANLTLRQTGGGNWFCVKISQGRLEIEDCDISADKRACVGILGGADPRLRRNRIHGSKDNGVFLRENAQGTLEDNDIFGNGLGGVEIKQGAAPTLRRNRIHDNKGNGVYVHENGQGTIEDNEIFSNGYSGVTSRNGGNPAVRNNRINRNASYGVRVYENGSGTFEDNDLTQNTKGPWSISEDSNVTRTDNK